MENAGRRIRILMTLLGLAVAVAVLNAMPATGVVEPPLAPAQRRA
jgi:hypothetical protein